MPTSTTRIVLPSVAPGTERTLQVHHYGTPGARPKAYVQAALHADEIPGLLVAQHLLRGLEQAQAAGRIIGEVVVIPVANPVGLSQHLNGRLLGRFDGEGTGNFNRGFPDLTTAARERLQGQLSADPAANVARIRAVLQAVLAEQPAARETEALKRALLSQAIDADWVFDLHCDGEALLHLYASQQQREEAVELGAELGAAAVLLEQEPGGNPFDEACAGPWWKLREALATEGPTPLACFATTVELRGQADVTDESAAADAAALLRFLQRRGVIGGEPGPLPELRCQPTPLNGVDVLTAPAAGVVVYRKQLGDTVAAGEVVAELVDPLGEPLGAARTPIYSKTHGLLLARMTERLARPGQKFCKVAGREPLDYRQAGKLLED
ncbi:MAG: succinylglutamate desuccinylase/aspartoacylase family protein [Candidatus Competibacter sp.]|nr:succinylglutamate desuccinylase/aspartoacylase family protein [Candidatus Competibacter sp.]MDG4605304.1 M14 family metallopeptidase [Candidatus Contendobacter sp.]HRD48175.1 M14 family metallopeptidase [Candidatus Contendobacter sp.]